MDEAFRASDRVLKKAAADKQVPWCSVFLVSMIVFSHTLVFMGNLETAQAFKEIGVSTGGWSGVGLELATSLEHELEDVLKTVADMLTKAIGEIMEVTDLIDLITGYQATSIDAVMSSDATKALVLLEAHGIMDSSSVGSVSGLISKSMGSSVDKLSGSVKDAMKKLLDQLKPALIEVGKFILKFGDKVQQIIQSFSVTLDRVQKVFDQVMASLSGGKKNEPLMMHQTFHMFDAFNTGAVTVEGLKDVGHLYDIPALQGKKSDELIKMYDVDKSGDLDHKEFTNLVHGGKIPSLLSVVLRSFGKSLAKVAGQIGGAHFRAEIADQTFSYLELMTAKNHTKVDWISDHLGNGSLPLPFVSGVLITAALKMDDPNTHKMVPTGAFVVNQMMKLHPKGFAKAFDNACNESFYLSQGYSADSFPVVVKRLTKWSTQKNPYEGISLSQAQSEVLVGAGGSLDADASTMKLDRQLVDTMENMAEKMAAANMKKHIAAIKEEERILNDEIFSSETSQFLFFHMLGGEKAGMSKSSSNPALAATKSQIPALPETLQFAKWLSWNATHTAKLFNEWSFKYQKTSSNAIDSFATQVQSMVKKIQGFIKMMMKYSTPEGIDTLEATLIDYAEAQMKAMMYVTKKRVKVLVAKDTKAHNIEAAHTPADRITAALKGPLGKGVAPAVQKALEAILEKKITDQSQSNLGTEISNLLETVANTAHTSVAASLESHVVKTASFLHVGSNVGIKAMHEEGMGSVDAALIADLKKDVHKALEAGKEVPKKADKNATDSKLASKDEDDENGIGDTLADLVEEAMDLMHALTHALPQASKALIFAKKEVSMLSKTLENIFKVFEVKGPEIMDEVGSWYAYIWKMYWLLMLVLPCSLLFYAFWSGGFFGGPGTKVDEPRVRRPNALAKLCGCIEDCCRCCCAAHNWQGYGGAEMCFWSVCLFLQFVVMVLFIMAILITIIAAVQFFLASGCAQIYLLGDESICGTVLSNLRGFLSTMFPGLNDFAGHCVSKKLLTCEMIGIKMATAAEYTVVGSFMAATFTFQMIIESGELHSRALTRIRFEQEWLKRHPIEEKEKK